VICSPGWGWAFNSRGQSPCLVAAYLLNDCQGPGFSVNPLPPDYGYVGPTKSEDNYCQCSTVTYSLLTACEDCQNVYFLPWSTWSYNCSTIYSREFIGDIPLGTSVPAWAYLDVISKDIFDPVAAQGDSNAPESSATSYKPTGTAPSSQPSTQPSTQTSTPTNAASKKTDIAPIVGGVVGGALGLLLLVVIVATIYVTRRRRQRALTAPSAYAAGYFNSPEMGSTSQHDTSQFSHFTPTSPQKLYDPSDPSTFPTTPATVYTTFAGSPVNML